VDFRVSDEQKAMAAAVRAFCGQEPWNQPWGIDLAGPATERAGRRYMHQLAELGVLGLRVPEASSGLGRSFADAVIVFEELGRGLAPTSTVWTHLAAGTIGGALTGEVVVGGIELDKEGPALVDDLDFLDSLLVLKKDRIERVDASKLVPKSKFVTPLDPLTPVNLVERVPAGERVGGREEAERFRLEGAALVAAELLGIAGAALAIAVDYAKVREQFGRPIGGFQAVKHILADMFVRLEIARAAVYAAGATLDAPEVGDAARAVAVAKIQAADAAILNGKGCVQVHGGMGYTWDVPAHFLLKRAWVLETAFGSRDENMLSIANHA
jgi:alkylation response protein AidB-like acyl-CoA dehydrogenase